MKRLLMVITLFSFVSHSQMLSTSGTDIVNDSGQEVLLKGIGLGGWMLQEGYMMNSNGAADTQHEFKAKLIELVGETETQLFYDEWLDNFVKEEDIDSIASWGYNSVRLAMHYNLFTLPIEDEPVQGENTWINTGFDMVDDLLDWCEANQIYLILDLHAAPGGQGYDAAISDYDSSKPSLWENDFNKSKTVALWGQLADRYKDEPWIGGYDLINEPNWNLSTYELRNLYVQITSAIRAVDLNHIIFIEGNWFANDFTGLTPPWDANMVYSFHKYWTYNDTASIQWVLDMRNQFNVPLWCGESGENSNVWYRDAIKLFEDNNIGWSWWPYKRIETTVAPFSISSNSNYESIISYWRGETAAPTTTNAIQGLSQLTNDLLIQNSTYFKDVVDAQIRQPQNQTHIPFANHSIPGVVYMSDFDLGTNGVAYSDAVVANYSLNTSQFEAWNSGWSYRNDGVDISSNSDTFNSNGYHISFVENQEWMNFTVDIQQSGFYNLSIRYASPQSGGKLKLLLDDADVSGEINLFNSGGYSNFVNGFVDDVYLEAGIKTIKVKVVGDVEFNLSSIEFIHATGAEPPFEAIGANTIDDEKTLRLAVNHPIEDQPILINQYTVKIDGVVKPINSAQVDPSNDRVLLLEMEDYLHYQDVITIDHIGNVLNSAFNHLLPELNNFPVENNLPSRKHIPGKIEAEEFSTQIGLAIEDTSDVLGGQNVGWTDTGDFAEYLVYVEKTGIYDLHLRTAAQNQQGILEFELINEQSTQSLGWFNLPITTGWQSWATSTFEINIDAGVYILKMKVLQPGFNINWFEFVYSDNNLGIEDSNIDYTQNIKVYPNPVDNIINVTTGSNSIIDKVKLLDLGGRIIYEKNYYNQHSTIQLNLPQIKSGVYILSIDTIHGNLKKRIIKQ